MDSRKFFRGVRQFYAAAFEYIIAKFPLRDDVLQHAKFVDFDKRQSCHFSDISYFMDHYQIVLGFSSNVSDRVFDEFVEYQLLDHDDIPQSLWEMAEERMKGSDSVFVREWMSFGVILAQ